jgi:hypothetical protein
MVTIVLKPLDMRKNNLFVLIILTLPIMHSCQNAPEKNSHSSPAVGMSQMPELSWEVASNFANIALNCIQKEYPNKLDHVMNDASEVLPPRTLHPSFYGCFDWHSSVHGHWMLVHLLKKFPDLPESSRIRKALDENLTAENIRIEVSYLDQPNRKSFERTYGWSWLLKLVCELYAWQDPDGKRWLENLEPLATAISDRYVDFLPRQAYPIRRGVHPNTAFGLSFAYDYALIAEKKEFMQLIAHHAKDYFLNDREIAARWEPDGDDFLSPSLMEADLICRILSPEAFINWFDAFLPDARLGQPDNLFQPVQVSDRSDPKIVHLDGLNLSRAWCMFRIADALGQNHPAYELLMNSARNHAQATLPHIASGHYEGEHWLASFAVYMYSCLNVEMD